MVERGYGGGGLGLAIRGCIIELEGGKIDVERKLNGGSGFEMVLGLR